MAKNAAENTPSAENIRDAVAAIEKIDQELLAEKMAYMKRCKVIRDRRADQFDHAADRGIRKKLLKAKIKERDLLRKADAVADDFEDDDRNEYAMLSEKLGEFGDTPLGAAALARAGGNAHAAA
ncbi:hypothetical protein [Bradyrhizobium sp. BRP23]|uniref:hypothetical protein n=1 Tax=Bradyrhizobium sp. BRP23 TaxID=2793820 RepID=UPI001CD732D5|nr:hypothetical protein [Bradyrhizobium sp. BRP23]MCA1419453.1 hypothetical protein [Bradyrhizobium sp. BRP23]